MSGLLFPRSTREQQRVDGREKLRFDEESNVNTFKVVDKLRVKSPAVKVVVSIERETQALSSVLCIVDYHVLADRVC